MAEVAEQPLPEITEENRPFWEATQRRKLVLQRCAGCREMWSPPSSHCPRCLSSEWFWEEVSGRGRVFTFTVVHQRYHPAFADAIPYNVAVIELKEGPRLVSTVECPKEELKIGMEVEVAFREGAKGFLLPVFVPMRRR